MDHDLEKPVRSRVSASTPGFAGFFYLYGGNELIRLTGSESLEDLDAIETEGNLSLREQRMISAAKMHWLLKNNPSDRNGYNKSDAGHR